MKDLFAETITPESGRITGFFQIRQADRKSKKDGSPYYALTLGDRTGTLNAKLWDVVQGFEPRPGEVVKIEGDASSYRDQLQVTIKRIRVATAEEWEKGDYIPASKQDRNDLLGAVTAQLERITDDSLRRHLLALFEDVDERLRDAPAAKKLHQAYLGGLCEHILNLCKLAHAVCDVYPELNRDILIAAAFIHDIGKLEEYCYDTHIGDTRPGRLLGHILQGFAMFRDHSATLDPATREHIEHIIASHHGQLDWGAARLPMTREAQIFHCLDLIDSRMAIIGDALNGPVDEAGFTPFHHALGTALWNGQ